MLARQQPFLIIPIPNTRMGHTTFVLDKRNAKGGLEPDDRNRFGVLPNLAQLPLPSSLSRRSEQLKATKDAPTVTRLRGPVFVVNEATRPGCFGFGFGFG